MKDSRLILPELGRRPGTGFVLPRGLLFVALGLFVLTGGTALVVLPAPPGPSGAVAFPVQAEALRGLRLAVPSTAARALNVGDTLSLWIGAHAPDARSSASARIVELSSPAGTADSVGVLVVFIGPHPAVPASGGSMTVRIGTDVEPSVHGPLERLRGAVPR
jgi:hypothetical protein